MSIILCIHGNNESLYSDQLSFVMVQARANNSTRWQCLSTQWIFEQSSVANHLIDKRRSALIAKPTETVRMERGAYGTRWMTSIRKQCVWNAVDD